MGRKIEMKKIQDNIKCQVTFSKRRASLIKKAEEISMICDVDVAFLAFSPAGRISKFCNRERMVDFLDLYVNLPAERRLSHVKNVQVKMGKLQSLSPITSEDEMSKFLNDQIENLKLQLEKNKKEVQLAEANLRDFELNPAQEASLHQLSWCERNLQHCLEKVKEIKKEKILMETEGATAMTCLYSQNGSSQFESWRNNEYKYPDNIFNEMLGKGKGKEVEDAYGTSIPTSYRLHQSVPETQTSWLLYDSLQNNIYNAMHQLGNAMATNAPSQFNVNHVSPQQYGQNYASDKQDHQLWMQAPMPWQQVESNSSFGNFSGPSSNFMENHLSSYPSGSTLADNFWETPMVDNQPNVVVDHMDMDAIGEGNEIYNNNEEAKDAVTEMIVSPPPSVQAPPSTSGVPNDLDDLPPSEDPSRDLSWIDKIEDTHMWDWDNLNF